jgi:hypothetical protein
MNNNAKYAFYYLLSLVSLIFTALAVGMIVFGIVDKTVADALVSAAGVSDNLKFAISALIIAAPLFFVTEWQIERGLRHGELDRDSGVRRWLTYFILLVSSVTMLGVFIGIINNFLSGEFTVSFILKAVSMLVISGAVFSFYLYDIRRKQVKEKSLTLKIFFYASLAVITAAFIASWFFIESPATTRAKRLDQNLVNNINGLENAVNSYYDKYKKLPDNFAQIQTNTDIYLDPRSLTDPETGVAIDYRPVDSRSFQLCAVFRTDNKNTDLKNNYTYADPTKLHRAGYQCFTSNVWTADPKTTTATPVLD